MSVVFRNGAEPIPGYKLVKSLGVSAFQETWEVRTPNGSTKLWKIIDLQRGNASIESRTLRLLVQLHHPHLNTLTNFWQLQDGKLLVLESEVPLMTLRERLNSTMSTDETGGIPADELLPYFEHVADGLDFLNSPRHEFEGDKVSIHHRALKPECLLLFSDGQGGMVCKLSDFGLAKPVANRNAENSISIVHTDYDPPEFVDGRTEPTSDQYALAINYFELRTGRCPFSGSMLEQVQARLSDSCNLNALPARERPPIKRALSAEPSKRYASCSEFVKDLIECAFTQRPGSSAAPIRTAAPPSSSGIRYKPSDAETVTAPAASSGSDTVRLDRFTQPVRAAGSSRTLPGVPSIKSEGGIGLAPAAPPVDLGIGRKSFFTMPLPQLRRGAQPAGSAAAPTAPTPAAPSAPTTSASPSGKVDSGPLRPRTPAPISDRRSPDQTPSPSKLTDTVDGATDQTTVAIPIPVAVPPPAAPPSPTARRAMFPNIFSKLLSNKSSPKLEKEVAKEGRVAPPAPAPSAMPTDDFDDEDDEFNIHDAADMEAEWESSRPSALAAAVAPLRSQPVEPVEEEATLPVDRAVEETLPIEPEAPHAEPEIEEPAPAEVGLSPRERIATRQWNATSQGFVGLVGCETVSAECELPALPIDRSAVSTIYGRCIRIGGAQRAMAELLTAEGKLFQVELTEKLAKQLVKRLYEEVGIEGEPVWSGSNGAMEKFVAHRLTEHRTFDPRRAFVETAKPGQAESKTPSLSFQILLGQDD